jgi:hypothetical protein
MSTYGTARVLSGGPDKEWSAWNDREKDAYKFEKKACKIAKKMDFACCKRVWKEIPSNRSLRSNMIKEHIESVIMDEQDKYSLQFYDIKNSDIFFQNSWRHNGPGWNNDLKRTMLKMRGRTPDIEKTTANFGLLLAKTRYPYIEEDEHVKPLLTEDFRKEYADYGSSMFVHRDGQKPPALTLRHEGKDMILFEHHPQHRGSYPMSFNSLDNSKISKQILKKDRL